MPVEFKPVPAVDKCFKILDLFAKTDQPLGISEVSKQLLMTKSTVFGIIHTLAELGVLENGYEGKFRLGSYLFTLAKTAGSKSELLQTVHPYLEKISRKTKLSAFLGIRSGLSAIIVDKVDSAGDIKISSDVGMRLPLLAGAGGKALLSLLSDEEIDKILSENKLKKFTSRTQTSRSVYKREIFKTRETGITFEVGEYIEGVIAFAIPLKTFQADLQAAIWAVGLKERLPGKQFANIEKILKSIADEVNHRFSVTI